MPLASYVAAKEGEMEGPAVEDLPREPTADSTIWRRFSTPCTLTKGPSGYSVADDTPCRRHSAPSTTSERQWPQAKGSNIVAPNLHATPPQWAAAPSCPVALDHLMIGANTMPLASYVAAKEGEMEGP